MNDIDTLKTSGWGGAANAFCNGRVKWRNFQLVLWNIILEWDLVADGMSLACVIYSTAAPTNEVTKPWPNNGTHHLDELAWKTSRQHHPRHRIILIPCHLFHFIVIWFFFSLFLSFCYGIGWLVKSPRWKYALSLFQPRIWSYANEVNYLHIPCQQSLRNETYVLQMPLTKRRQLK